VDHDILVLKRLLWVLLFTSRLSLVHLHIVTSFLTLALTLLFLLILTFTLFNVDLLAAGFRHGIIIARRPGCVLATGHVLIFSWNGDSTFGTFDFILFFLFLGAILVAVCLGGIGFGLVGWELGGCRLLGIPVSILVSSFP
jgi:hypothetical protein